jgi:DNA modification methylase
MNPYYQDDAVTIYHGDCREVVPMLYPVDLVVTSPPYNLNGDGNNSAGTYFRNLATGYATHADDMPHTEYVAWQREVLARSTTTTSRESVVTEFDYR